MSSRTAVVILNWNGISFLQQFLPAVVKFSSAESEVIVADNASTDESVAWVRSAFPSVRIIQHRSNGGFAKGYNDALRDLDHDYFVLLNSDVEVTENWLTPLVAMMNSDQKTAACQPKIRSFHQKEKFEYAGAAGGFIDKWGYTFCRGRIFDTCETDNGQYDDDRDIFWATGACLMIRRDAWVQAEGLDEDFFAHMEEVDLCWHLRNAGWKIKYCGRSTVYHVGGGTLSKQNAQKTYLNFRNNLVLLFKNHAPGYFWLKIFLRMTMDGIAGMKFLFSGEFAHTWAVLRAHGSFYARLGSTLRKRRATKKNITKYATSSIYRKTLIMEYYFRGKKKFSDLDPSAFSD
ncbi:MAG TPA: glycosyltransferase family 2 protein [Bacteroidia bacterium]|jgi:GT2 family glycosyltransferase|nr:glycosyltransferase family 2 protein [Bacteroidia bacterium]